jgi:cytochrome b
MPSSNRVRAWDVPTRMFKWSLVAAIAAAWATNKYAAPHPEWHKWSGYAALTLVIFRLFWGVCGSTAARFSSFVVGPRSVAKYAWSEMRGRQRHFLGHNPLGGWMVVALLAAVAAQAVLGLFSAGDDWTSLRGPLAHTVSDGTVDAAMHLHRLGFDLIVILVVVHVTANVFLDVVRRAGLIRGIITGNKPQAAYVDAPHASSGSMVAATACFMAAALTVFGFIRIIS